MVRTTAPFGSWPSPITPDLVASHTRALGHVALDGGTVYWIEGRPDEHGRFVIYRQRPGEPAICITPTSVNTRTRVHEYGGADFAVADGTVYFSNFDDHCLYRQGTDGTPEPLTAANLGHRYADLIVDRPRARLIAVREQHHPDGREATNTLVSISLSARDQEGRILAEGHDFYAHPRLSPDGRQLAYLTWNHPLLPWIGCELWVAEVRTDGSLKSGQRIAGGEHESLAQPEWSPDGILTFISDRSGWWNLYRWEGGQARALHPMEAEFAAPHWRLGQSTYAYEDASHIICCFTQHGTWRLARLEVRGDTLDEIALPYLTIAQVHAGPGFDVFIGGAPALPTRLIRLDRATGQQETLHEPSPLAVDSRYLSEPEPISFPSTGGRTAYGWYYPPLNPEALAPAGTRPPLLVYVHGGPTSAAAATLSLQHQFWTSRGLAVLDVNYGGSSGYGRAFRDQLAGAWGVVDVDDAVSGARALVERGAVDGARLGIMGGSAGGYTTLAALAFRDVFHAGASHFGLSDLEIFAHETHKFESRYMDYLIGPREDVARYRERSPIYALDRFARPVMLFQGLDDKIVPPNQAELIMRALRQRGVPVGYLTFEGEGHGFRRRETIAHVLEAELAFFARIFGFIPADAVPPVALTDAEAARQEGSRAAAGGAHAPTHARRATGGASSASSASSASGGAGGGGASRA